jgi:hypothetical protein
MSKAAYLAGPMRGYPEYNFPAFHEAEARGKALGWSTISPARMDEEHGFDPASATEETVQSMTDTFIDRDFGAIRALIVADGDAIALLPGWEQSRGARAEHALAVWRGLRVLDARTFDDLVEPQVTNLCPSCEARAKAATSECGDEAAYWATHGQDEVRYVDPQTGGEKGEKAACFHLLPWDVLWADAELYGAGQGKYGPRNWEAGYPWHLSFSAAMRHLAQFWGGESIDAETGGHHLACARFHMAALLRFESAGIGTDDRPGAAS